MGTSRIEQIIEDIYDFVESCKPKQFSSSRVIVPKDELYDLLDELKLRTPDEIKRYQKIIANRDTILADAEKQAEAITEEARLRTDRHMTARMRWFSRRRRKQTGLCREQTRTRTKFVPMR